MIWEVTNYALFLPFVIENFGQQYDRLSKLFICASIICTYIETNLYIYRPIIKVKMLALDIQQVNVAGCRNVTENGLYHVLSNCQGVEGVIGRATNIGLVHFNETERLVSLKVQGCPMVSPGPLQFDNVETISMQARNVYFKSEWTSESHTDEIQCITYVIIKPCHTFEHKQYLFCY